MNGVLNINKPKGWTSHDVVAKCRGILKERKIGHLGTLDPLATGVLPLALGLATRLIEFAQYPKEYVTTCLLGKTTDSCDATGQILSENSMDDLPLDFVRKEVLKLREVTEQIPPMVSAIHKEGKRLYEWARKGIVLEREARHINIEEVEALQIELPRVKFRIVCSAGTYVRALCQSLGEAVGKGGCMESLERTRVGPFSIQDAVTLEELEKRVETGKSDMLLPSCRLVNHLPVVKLEENVLVLLCRGQTVKGPLAQEGLYRILNGQGLLSAIADLSAEGKLKPRKVFGLEGIP